MQRLIGDHASEAAVAAMKEVDVLANLNRYWEAVLVWVVYLAHI